MYDSPVGYPKGKKDFLWLIWVRIDGKKMIVILLEVIIEDFDYPFGSRFKCLSFYLVFYFWEKAIYHIKYIIRGLRGWI